MGARGPAPKPALQVVREGNPGHHGNARLARGVRLPPGRPDEPDWRTWFAPEGVRIVRRRKGESDADLAQRKQAAEFVSEACSQASLVWRWASGVLDPQGLVTHADALILADLAVTWVRIRQAEQDVSVNGLRHEGKHGMQRNGSIVTAMQYRAHWKWLCGQLGLSPVARDGMNPEGDDGEGSPFDV